MRSTAKSLLALAVLAAGLGPVQAGGPPPRRAAATDSAVKQAAIDEARRVAAKIDEFIDAGLDKHIVRGIAVGWRKLELGRALPHRI